MNFVTKTVVVLAMSFCFLPCLDGQPGKKRLTKEQIDKYLAKRPEKQQVREAFKQAAAVRGLVQKLSSLVRDEDEEVRYNAARGLSEIGPSAILAVGTLTSRLFDESPRVRAAAVDAFASIGPAAKEAVPDLVILLQDSDILVRRRVTNALASIHSFPEIAVPALIKALDDPDQMVAQGWSVHLGAITALSKFETQAKAAYPRLLKEFREGKDPSIRGFILDSMAATKANTPEVLRLLIDLINDPNQEGLHAAAATVAGHIGPEAKSTIPHLLKLFECKNLKEPKLGREIQPAILRALGKMGGAAREVVPTIIGYCADPILAQTPARHHAFGALGDLGPDAKEAIPFLIDCLQKSEYVNQFNLITRALRRIGKDSVQPLIRAYLTVPEKNKGPIISALGSMGTLASDALPLLEVEAQRPPPSHRAKARIAIRFIKLRRPR
jgi:HEAT repeat protein